MSKKVVSILSNDWHLSESTSNSLINLTHQLCNLCKEHNVDNISILGDVFQSRAGQVPQNLNTLTKIFDILKENTIVAHIIPGNHDKYLYSSNDSYLDVYNYHPNVNVYRDVTQVNLNGLNVVFVPFWEDSILVEKLKTLEKGDIILSHFGVNGSQNNDGSKHESDSITVSLLKKFKKVLLGHYHNQHQVSSNIFHLPSIQQNNFGEDTQKGFTLLYEDGSHELVKSKFKEYKSVTIDVKGKSQKDINELVREYTGSECNVRVELVGEQNLVNSIKVDKLKDAGIKVKKKIAEVEYEDIEFTEEVVQHTVDTLRGEFKIFCEENKHHYPTGVKYFNKQINK